MVFQRSQPLRSVLAHAGCRLVQAMDDIYPAVSQRATVYLGTIHDRGIQSLIWCFECQADLVPSDRPHILKSLYQLFNTLAERTVLSWQFFANRFDSIICEIQECKVAARQQEENGEAGAGPGSGVPVRLRLRPRSGTDSVRSLAGSLGPQYQRTCSAPSGMPAPRPAPPAPPARSEEAVADFRRQQSAPLPRTRPAPPTRLASSAPSSEDEGGVGAGLELPTSHQETLHLLVFLFMQFLSQPQQASMPENKAGPAHQAMQRSFSGLFSLLGYDEREQRFTTMPHRIRTTAQVQQITSNISVD